MMFDEGSAKKVKPKVNDHIQDLNRWGSKVPDDDEPGELKLYH